MRLATRTFLWSVVPFAVLLACSFWAVQTLVLREVREGLRSNVKDTQQSIARMRSTTEQKNSNVLRVVAENAALKAVVQLLLENAGNREARGTVEDRLSEICGQLGFDFLMVSNGDGRGLAAVMRQGAGPGPLDLAKVQPPREGYFTAGDRTYQVTSVPIDDGSENLGTLSVGEQLDLSAVPFPAVLIADGKILASNATGFSAGELESGLRDCPQNAECEVRLHGESYISLPMEQNATARGYRLRSLQNVDAAIRPIHMILRSVFLLAGLAALALAVFVSGISSRSIVRPISGVIARLHESAKTGELPQFEEPHQQIHEVRELTASFNHAAAAIRDARDRLHGATVEFIESLASALDARDQYTAGHSRRVSDYACAIAREMQLPPEQFDQIRVGALLHDIGKIGISDSILRKPGRLTDAENAIIRQHPSIGRRILEGVHGFKPYLGVVELHHENWDGSGYPKGLTGEDTPLSARVVKLADAYDAMTSDRPYRQGMTHAEALATILSISGTQLDPAIVEVFTSLPPLKPEALKPAIRRDSLERLAAALNEAEETKVAAVLEGTEV